MSIHTFIDALPIEPLNHGIHKYIHTYIHTYIHYVQIRTCIGYGSSNQGSEKVHGAPLGESDLKNVKRFFNFDPQEVRLPISLYSMFIHTYIHAYIYTIILTCTVHMYVNTLSVTIHALRNHAYL